MLTQETTELVLREVPVAEVLGEGALIRAYAEECSILEIGEINPQQKIYDNMEKAGLMRTFGVFVDATIVGFATILIFVLPHYGKKVATVESLFVSKAHRRSNAGLKLMAHIEEAARAAGCTVMLYNARSGTNLEKLLTVLPQYQLTNSVFLKDLS